MKLILKISILLVTIFIVSCSTNSPDDLTEPITDVAKFTYAANVKPILESNCTTCHGGLEPQAMLSLETYQGVFDIANTGKLIARLTDPVNPMPQNGLLPSTTVDIIKKWIDDGLLEQ